VKHQKYFQSDTAVLTVESDNTHLELEECQFQEAKYCVGKGQLRKQGRRLRRDRGGSSPSKS